MTSKVCCLLLILSLVLPLAVVCDTSSGTSDGSEAWGYTSVRSGAHLFWWLYYSTGSVPESFPIGSKEDKFPLIMWLQGGPGASGVGYGNFYELGPLTVDLLPRQYTWLKRAHLLFVDNPVGTGFSYVENETLLTKTNEEITTDLITFLRVFFTNHPLLVDSPFYVFCESYGGKYTSQLGVAIHEALSKETLKTNFQGVAMGDSWISPIDYSKAWGPQLRTLGLLDDYGEKKVNRYGEKAEIAISEDRWTDASTLWADQESAIDNLTDHVDFYNVLKHENLDDSDNFSFFKSHLSTHLKNKKKGEKKLSFKSLLKWEVPFLERHKEASQKLIMRRLSQFYKNDLFNIMNGPIKKKLGIIPTKLSWGMSSGPVFMALYEDFMKPTVYMVDRMLELKINVSIFSGQLDLICCTDGTLNWMKNLKWSEMGGFFNAPRSPLYCPGESSTGGFVKKYKNLSFFWIMNAGHMVPADNGCMALTMVEMITDSRQ